MVSRAQTQRHNGDATREYLAASRLCVRLLFLSTLCGSHVAESFSQPRADFIIIEQPQRLTILNRYQQQLSSQEKSSLKPFSPYRIITADETLGDGLTLCMRVEADGATLYFVKDDAGELIGGEDAKTFRNVVPLADTITIIKRNAIELFDAAGRKRSPLAEGTRLRRLFQSSRLTYVQVVAGSAFGWVNLRGGENITWTIRRAATASAEKSLELLLPDIQRKLSSVNEQLAKLYDVWNRKTSESRTPPQWRLQPGRDTLVATLSGDSLAQFYKESTRWLSKDIELLLLGSRFRVTATTGRIEIR